jgi:hypothetical protein
MAEKPVPTVGDLEERLPGATQDLIGNGLAQAALHLQSAVSSMHPMYRGEITLLQWMGNMLSAYTNIRAVLGILETAAPQYDWAALAAEAERQIAANDEAMRRGEPPPYPGPGGSFQPIGQQPPIPPAFEP